MKKIKNFFTKNIKIFLAFVLGILVSFGVVYAATVIGAGEVSYTPPSGSGISSTNVQDAIDDLYQKANKPGGKNNTVYFAYGTPTTSSTTDYTTLNKKVFVALNGGQKSVCIIRNSRLHCFDNNNYAIEKDHIQQVFSDISCYVGSSNVGCYASDFDCDVYEGGNVRCSGYSDNSYCSVYDEGSLCR